MFLFNVVAIKLGQGGRSLVEVIVENPLLFSRHSPNTALFTGLIIFLPVVSIAVF